MLKFLYIKIFKKNKGYQKKFLGLVTLQCMCECVTMVHRTMLNWPIRAEPTGSGRTKPNWHPISMVQLIKLVLPFHN